MEIISKSVTDDFGNLMMDVTIKSDGEILHKVIGVEDYLQMFSKNIENKAHFVEVPRLPETVVSAYMDSERADSFKAIVRYPAEKRAFSFMGQQMLLPFPALHARIVVEKGVRKETQLYAIKDLDAKEPILCQYPFGNVNSYGGGCCYGNIVIQNLKDVSYAPSVLDAFLFGETNNDLWGSKRVKNGAGAFFETQGDLIEALKGLDSFPEEWLVEVG